MIHAFDAFIAGEHDGILGGIATKLEGRAGVEMEVDVALEIDSAGEKGTRWHDDLPASRRIAVGDGALECAGVVGLAIPFRVIGRFRDVEGTAGKGGDRGGGQDVIGGRPRQWPGGIGHLRAAVGNEEGFGAFDDERRGDDNATNDDGSAFQRLSPRKSVFQGDKSFLYSRHSDPLAVSHSVVRTAFIDCWCHEITRDGVQFFDGTTKNDHIREDGGGGDLKTAVGVVDLNDAIGIADQASEVL